MPWEMKTVDKVREEFVQAVQAGIQSKASLCREYGISRPTGDKWLARYNAGESLSDRSSAEHRTPLRTPEDVEDQIIALRLLYPGIGAKKLKRILENRGSPMPCATTVNNILHRYGCISPEASAAATPNRRFQMDMPNDLWQADYKGHFPLSDGVRCHPLNILDDCSRFCLCSDAKENERFLSAKESFTKSFREYGLPKRLLCDNGNPWGTPQSTGFTVFEVWLMELGVMTIHGRMRHPQTQGKEERFNGSQTRELLKHRSFDDMKHAQAELERYRRFYNEERPHEALNMETPASVYRPSTREMPERIRPWEYENSEVCKVKDTGFMTYKGQGYFLSEAFRGKEIAIKASDEEHCYDILFRQFCIARLNIYERCFVSKKIKMCK